MNLTRTRVSDAPWDVKKTQLQGRAAMSSDEDAAEPAAAADGVRKPRCARQRPPAAERPGVRRAGVVPRRGMLEGLLARACACQRSPCSGWLAACDPREAVHVS